MRLPYAPSTPPTEGLAADEQQSIADIYSRIAARRNPRPLIPLDLTFLHSPPVADGFNEFLGAIRSRTHIDGGLLELAICRVAVLNGAVYEWNAHAPLAIKAGVTEDQLAECKDLPFTAFGDESSQAPAGSALDETQWLVLLYTDAMTRNIRVPQPLFDLLKARLADREVFELTAGVAAYNCVSRVLVALDVGENNDKTMKEASEVQRDVDAARAK
jgi:alkylhydroperoxidase family enzyme